MDKSVINPFFLTANIPAQYFCDREKETDLLIKYIINGNNLVLISPRRMGKSGLIHHCYENPAIRKNFAAIYFDILQTSSLREFVYIFGKTVYDNLVPKTTKWITAFLKTLKSLNGKFSFDPLNGLLSFSMMLGDIESPSMTLNEIFSFLENYDKRVVIAIDEFQQITKYPEKNVEAILRSHIQHMNNVKFIYSGSERHLMAEMFASYSRPFYQSASVLALEAIPREIYVNFAKSLFIKNGKKVNVEAIGKLYDLFAGTTFFMQKTLNECYANLDSEQECDVVFIEKTLNFILDMHSPNFRFILSNLPEKQKDLLYAIAISDTAENITSAEFIKKFALTSASSVQSASKQLLEKEFISKSEGKYSLTDKFFSLWIKKIYGPSFNFFD